MYIAIIINNSNNTVSRGFIATSEDELYQQIYDKYVKQAIENLPEYSVMHGNLKHMSLSFTTAKLIVEEYFQSMYWEIPSLSLHIALA